MVYDEEGASVNQSTVSVTVQQTAWPGNPERANIKTDREPEWVELDEMAPFETREKKLQVTSDTRGVASSEVPFLQCTSPITVESGEVAEIQCTGLHPSGDLLEYSVRFDWPPYRKTELLGEGEFVYMVRAPMIEKAASVQILEVSAEIPGVGQAVSEQVEIHVINRAPKLQCEDITVDEGTQIDVPCSITDNREARIQFLSELMPRGIYHDWPTISIPEVNKDTSIVMTVRAFGEGESVTESDFLLKVQQTRTPLDFEISCTSEPVPLPYIEYEGDGPSELMISCTVDDGPKENLIWQWGAERLTTPFENLNIQFNEDRQPTRAIISLPQDVNGDEFWQYKLGVSIENNEGVSEFDQILIDITILERPDISIDCGEDIKVRTGDPPLELTCTPSTDLVHRDAPLEYVWEWTSENGLPLLSGDLRSGMPIFNVPAEQDEAEVTYTYMVGASAPNTDPPETPEMLTVIVEKYLGKLSLGCTSPIELYAGGPDFPLVCSVGQGGVPNLSYSWQLQEGPSDQLIAGVEPDSPPVFRVPASVEDPESYKYEIYVDAPYYDRSDTESVEIIVSQRSILSIDCEDVTVRAGDPPLTLTCIPSVDPVSQGGLPEIEWEWNSEDGGLSYLSGDVTTGMPIFNVPADQDGAEVTYTYMVTASAPNVILPENPAILTVTVQKYPISLECPEELVVTVGMPPERIVCTATSDENVSLEYVWEWTPTERLSDTSTGSPWFEIPVLQRAYSRTYEYTVTVSAERAISAQASTLVRVLSSIEDPAGQVEVTVSELDFGMVGPQGHIVLDPATELISGLVYDGAQSHSGRMMILARDSVTASIEQIRSVVLRHADSGHELILTPRFADSASCNTFSANTQSSRIVQILLNPEDCHVFRIGGEIILEQAHPGAYSGQIPVTMTVNGLDQLHTIPVVLTVEAERRVVLLGPDGVEFRAVSATGDALDWKQSISIQPQVAVLSPQIQSGTFEITNPSVHRMEVEVSMEFGYRETREQERFSVGRTIQEAVQGDLSAIVAVYPKIILLSPGETKSVHYGIPDDVQMQEHGYAGRFNFTVTPREFINQRQSPTTTNARIIFQAPGIYIPGPATLQASIESITDSVIVLLLEAGSIPFYGEVIVDNDSGDELGRSDVLVYTRSRVRIPLRSRATGELTLRFSTYAPNQRSPYSIYISSDSRGP